MLFNAGRRRFAALTLAALSATALLTATPAGAQDVCTTKVLNIVAHHDDDLLFLSPDLVGDIQDGICVRTVFMVASDYRTHEYMLAREEGIRAAYRDTLNAVRDPEDQVDWEGPETYLAGNVNTGLWTLGDTVSIVEVRAPDNWRHRQAEGEMWWMYALNRPVTTNNFNDEQGYNQTVYRGDFYAMLQSIAYEFEPDVINTTDPWADIRADLPYRHPDHVTVARLVMWSLTGQPGLPSPRYYRDYSTRLEGPNLNAGAVGMKNDAFSTYAGYDTDICGPSERWQLEIPCTQGDDISANGAYYDWIRRQYVVDQNWSQGYVVPLPDPVIGNDGPLLFRKYRVRNVGTGMEMAVENRSDADGANIIGWPATGTANQIFHFRMRRHGWELAPTHISNDPYAANKCLDMPNKSTSEDTQLTQYRCLDADDTPDEQGNARYNAHQSLKLRKNSDGKFTIYISHSGLALTSTGGAGSAVVQKADTGAANQRWEIIPV